MRKLTLNKDEAGIVYNVLNQPMDPRVGLTTKEVRRVSPVMDKLEALGETEVDGDSETIRFSDGTELVLKESEYNMVKDRLENSNGWINAAFVRKMVNPLIEKFEEAEKLPEADKDLKDEKDPKEGDKK